MKLLDHPPELREGGFDLDAGENARIVAGERRRAITKRHKTLNLWRDGTLIYAVEGDYLCWRMPSDRGLIINQLSLIESIYLFVRLSHEVYSYSTPKPKKLLYQVQIRNMAVNGVNPGLIPGALQRQVFGSDAVRALDSSKVIELTWDVEEIRVGEIAFKLASRFYTWFGVDENQIPYSEKSGGVRVISDAELRRCSAF